MSSVFEGGQTGVRALVEQTGWKVTAHNRYWSANTDYARQNGGGYDFFVDAKGSGAGGQMALPLEARFWEDLLENTTSAWGGGLATYEQDWCVGPTPAPTDDRSKNDPRSLSSGASQLFSAPPARARSAGSTTSSAASTRF